MAKSTTSTKIASPKKTKDKQRSAPTRLNIVGIGASAGGLEAINAFFENVPDNSGLSFVLIQHLSPDYKSMMPELLAKHTKMKVAKASNNAPIEPNCIYTIPPDKNMSIRRGKIFLEARKNPKELNLPINLFLNSLAEDQKERAIGVILSGTGSDGTIGIESIKENGGMVIAQDPVTTAFDNMPKSAISTGLVDFVLPAAKMPAAIINYIKHPYVKKSGGEIPDDDAGGDEIHQILTALQQRTKLDFRLYKKATVVRRIERRMSLRNIVDKGSYLKYLKTDPSEVELLGNDILIGVTGFFRDPKAFDALDKEVIFPLVKNLPKDKHIRIWVAGCSSGQEAYSIAILLKEQFRKLRKNAAFNIFATDIDQRAIHRASKGVFPSTLLEEIPRPLVSKYFTEVDGMYHVKKEIRQLIIFAKHDIAKDPPFNNIDLASCRNLLIYVEPQLQEKILSLLHFSLNENGFLFLGSSENIGVLSSQFTEIAKKYKIYKNISKNRSIDIKRLAPFDETRRIVQQPIQPVSQKHPSESRVISNFKDALLEETVPPTVIVNKNNDVVHVAGDIEKYIKLPRKQLSLNLLKLVNEQLYVPVSNAISKVKDKKETFVSSPVELGNSGEQFVRINARPFVEPISKEPFIMISFLEVQMNFQNGAKGTSNEMSVEKDSHIRRLEEDLKEAKEYLQSTIEQLETSNEELQATNEELMAANEELQSSNEELQSVNEELYTVNNEFENKIQEMTELTDDLSNFLQSTHIATLFLDNDLNIKRFTDAVSQLIKINNNDIGRYIGDFNNTFVDFNLINTAKSVLGNFRPIERDLMTSNEETFLLRVMPYVTAKREVKGVVFVFVDVNELKKIELQLKAKASELEHTNVELEQFAYLASHDLKAPITNLESLLGLMESEGGIRDKNDETFKKLKSTASRMKKTISILNEVIAVKKSLELKSETINLEDALNEILEGIEVQIKEQKAKVTTDFRKCPTVYFPPIHFQNILQNLITNAIKYHKQGHRPVVTITSERENGFSAITVRDEGRGINMNNFGNKVFGLFQRFHLDVEGKGIGLHISKSIIERYGGKIEVTSTEGEGSTFKILLKVQEKNVKRS